MGSLTDLNFYSTNTFTVTDDRDPGPKFNLPAVFDLDFTESSVSFTVERQGVEVREIIRPSEADLYFVIDASSFPTVTVSLPSVPAGVTVTNPGNANVWFIGPINDVATWDLVKDPTITLPNEFNGSFFYNVQWRWQNRSGITQFQSYQVGVFIPVANLTAEVTTTPNTQLSRIRQTTVEFTAFDTISASLQAAGLSDTTTETNFFANQTNLLTGHPEVVYAETTGTEIWTVDVEPTSPSQITGVTTYGTGGTVTFDSLTSVTTIEGTVAQVNSHLNSFYYTVNNSKLDFTFTYTASSTATGSYEDVRVQTVNCRNNDIVNLPIPTYYGGTSSTSLADIPNIFDIDYNLSGNYTYELEFLTPSDATTASTTGISRFWASNTVSTNMNLSNNYDEVIAVSHDGRFVAYGQAKQTGSSEPGGFLMKIWEKVNTTWTLRDTIELDYQRSGGLAGEELRFADDYTLIFSSPQYGADASSSGARGRVFVFELAAGPTWTLAQTISDSNKSFIVEGLSDSGDVMIVRDSIPNQDPIYVYTRTGTGNYSLDHTFSETTGSFSGAVVSGDGSTVVYGFDNMSYPNYINRLFFYRNIGGTWTLMQTNLEGVDYIPETFQLNNDGSRLYYFNNGLKWLDETSGTWYRNENTYSVTSTFTTNGSYNTNNGGLRKDLLIGLDSTDTTIGVWKDITNGDNDIEIHTYTNGAWQIEYTVSVPGTRVYDSELSKDGTTLITSEDDPDVFFEYSYSPDPADFAAGVLTQTGTREEINQDLLSLQFTPAVDEQDILTQITVTTPDGRSETIDYTIGYRLAVLESQFSLDFDTEVTKVTGANLNAQSSLEWDGTYLQETTTQMNTQATMSANIEQIYPYVLNASIDRQYIYDNRSTYSVVGNFSSAGIFGDDPTAVPFIATDIVGYNSGRYYNAFITTSGGYLASDVTPNYVSGTTGVWVTSETSPRPEAGWVEGNSLYFSDPNYAGNEFAGNEGSAIEGALNGVYFHPVHSSNSESSTSVRSDFTMRIQIYEYTTSSPTSGTSGTLISDTTVNLTYGGPA